VRKANLEKIHDRFEQDLQKTRDRLIRLETLIKKEASGKLVQDPKPAGDLTWLFEAGCLTVYARWVSFAQELVVGLLNRDSSRVRENLSPFLPRHLTVDAWEALLTWNRNFPGDPDALKRLAKDVLATSPFDQLRTEHWKALRDLHAIRNAVSHPSSRQAKRRYRTTLVTSRSPGTFLRARAKPARPPRLVEYIDKLLAASQAMRGAYTSP
jgi:hypothetical protein